MRTLDEIARVADRTLHPRVHAWVEQPARLDALREELAWSITDAVTDMEFARDFAAAQPQSGQPPQAFLNRWIAVADELTVVAGPRHRRRDPNRPFVAIDAASRSIRSTDLAPLREVIEREFAAFEPGYLTVWTSDPAGAWPETGADMRNVAGRLGDLRRNDIPDHLDAHPVTNLDFYQRYVDIHMRHVERDPHQAEYTHVETRERLAGLVDAGTLLDVRLGGGQWAGVIAAEPDARCGLRGFTVVELLLDDDLRGLGYGQHLSTLLARHLPAPDEAFLMGTIHADNLAAYRSATRSGRFDIGGEVVINLR